MTTHAKKKLSTPKKDGHKKKDDQPNHIKKIYIGSHNIN